MIPIVVDPKTTPLALIGRGPAAHRRLELLLAGGADDVVVFSDTPDPELEELAGPRLRRHLPEASESARFGVIWIADLPLVEAAPLARAGRAAGALVNVEDVRDWCDFHNPSVVRRGDLLLTVSTGGRSPGLASRIRRRLETLFGPEWAAHLDRVDARRRAWRRRKRPVEELSQLTGAMIDRRGWLPAETPR